MKKETKEYYMYMEDEYNYKNNKGKKIAMFLIFLAIVIAISSCMGILYAKKKIAMQNQNEEHNMGENSEDIDIENTNPEVEEIIEKPIEEIEEIEQMKAEFRLPIYTEVGKENMKNVYSSTSDNKRVFLTFDDGPSSNITPLILDLLKENNVKATFFTLGSRVIQNPQIVKREYEEGHYIANHGYSHVYSSIYASKENLLDEYNKTEDAIRNAIEIPEYSSHLFRFPGGSNGGKYDKVKNEYKKILVEQEVFYVDWNCLNEDASGNRTKEQLVDFIKKYSANKNSVVVLMHDAGDKILTYETLQEVIDYFRENEYTFCNFYDVIEYEMKYEIK